MLTLIGILALLALTLAVLFWIGTTGIQGYLYENVAAGSELLWRAPAAGAAVTAFFGLWVVLDYRGYTPKLPLPYDALHRVSWREAVPPVDEFIALRQGKETKYTKRKNARGLVEYVDDQGKPCPRCDEVVIKEADGEARFKAEKDANGYFKAEKGESLKYIDAQGRVMLEGEWQWTVTRPGLFLANVALNLAHGLVWFLPIWLLLRFQWTHAFGLALACWLVMTLAILPMLLDQVQAHSVVRSS